MQYQKHRNIGGLIISSVDSVNIIMVWNEEFGIEFQLLNIYDRNLQECNLHLIVAYHGTG